MSALDTEVKLTHWTNTGCSLLTATSWSSRHELSSVKRNCFDQATPYPLRHLASNDRQYKSRQVQHPCLNSWNHLKTLKLHDNWIVFPKSCFSPLFTCVVLSNKLTAFKSPSQKADLRLLVSGMKKNLPITFLLFDQPANERQWGALYGWFVSKLTRQKRIFTNNDYVI